MKMQNLFTTDDGGLKSGRIAFLLFSAFLEACALAFQLSKPMDQAMVAVQHVFEAQPEAEEPPAAPAEETPAQPPEPAPEPAKPESKPEQVKPDQAKTEPPKEMKKPGPETDKPEEAPASAPPEQAEASEPPATEMAHEQTEPAKKTDLASLTIGEQTKDDKIRFKPLPVSPPQTIVTRGGAVCYHGKKRV